jgi:hypothetical protein
MEVAIGDVAAQDHGVLMNYILIIVMIPYSIICMIAMCLAIQLYVMLWVGFVSVIVLVLNCQLCILTGVEPGTGLDGMYVLADIFAVAFIMFTFLLRYMREGDDDEDGDEQVVEINETCATKQCNS